MPSSFRILYKLSIHFIYAHCDLVHLNKVAHQHLASKEKNPHLIQSLPITHAKLNPGESLLHPMQLGILPVAGRPELYTVLSRLPPIHL